MSHFDESTGEHVIVLANGFEIRSGWLDHDDPDALSSGDYLSVFDSTGQQVYYVESSELLYDFIEGRKLLNQFFELCSGVKHGPTNSGTSVDETSEA